jgi:hypothetical protein
MICTVCLSRAVRHTVSDDATFLFGSSPSLPAAIGGGLEANKRTASTVLLPQECNTNLDKM